MTYKCRDGYCWQQDSAGHFFEQAIHIIVYQLGVNDSGTNYNAGNPVVQKGFIRNGVFIPNNIPAKSKSIYYFPNSKHIRINNQINYRGGWTSIDSLGGKGDRSTENNIDTSYPVVIDTGYTFSPGNFAKIEWADVEH